MLREEVAMQKWMKIARIQLIVLCTHADRQGVDISVTVCNFCFLLLLFSTVTDFSAEDNSSGVKFLHGGSSASREPRDGNSPIFVNFAPL